MTEVAGHQESQETQKANFDRQRKASCAADAKCLTLVIDFGSKFEIGRLVEEPDGNFYQRGKVSVLGVAVWCRAKSKNLLGHRGPVLLC